MDTSRTRSRRAGLIGVGLAGTALSERLLAAGYHVVGFDLDAGRLDNLKQIGGHAARSAAQAADGLPYVILSLPTSAVAGRVIREMEDQLAPGTILIDTTTGDPDEIAGFGAHLAARGVDYIDATIGGSSRLVREGKAILICGGEPATFAACREVFEVFGGAAFHVGPCGAGARMKLVLNLVLGLNRAALAEGLSYAKAIGIDLASALEVLKAGPAFSRAMEAKGAKMIAGDFAVEARLSQHLKDVRLILASGERSGASLPLSEKHRELLERAEALGFGGADNSAVIMAYEGKPGK